MTAEGEHLGTFDGETKEGAILAMYKERTGLHWTMLESSVLVRFWGGRAVRVGSIPAMAAVSEGAKS